MAALEELIGVIETIKSRIGGIHAESLRQNETRTRQALIDPLLNALGWDVADPAQVMLEYQSGGSPKRADYALLRDGTPVAVVEAKNLGRKIDDSVFEQGWIYSNPHGIKYIVGTNGDDWIMKNVFEPDPSMRELMRLRISREPSHESAIGALRLLRPNLASGDPARPVEPVFRAAQATRRVPPETPIHPPSPATVRSQDATTKWVRLDDDKLVSVWGPRKSGPKPRLFLKLAGGQATHYSFWADLLKAIVEGLLVGNGRIAGHCPYPHDKKTYFLNHEPAHKSGRRFTSKRELSNGMWLNVALNSAHMQRHLCGLLKECGVEPKTVELGFQPQ